MLSTHTVQAADDVGWPSLPLASWRDTRDTLHMYTQIIGKLPLALAPQTNHWWHVALGVTSRGLITPAMPHDERTFEVEFDFVDHNLVFRVSDGSTRSLALVPRTVADFYAEVRAILHALDLDTHMEPKPVEVSGGIPFEQDSQHASYDAAWAHRFWRVLQRLDVALRTFRGRFVGKSSPVQFYWGSFDLALTRFSGRAATPPEGAGPIRAEAQNAEHSCVGFWPGDAAHPEPMLFAYTWPEPPGYASAKLLPSGVRFDPQLREFLLPYDRVARSSRPDAMVLDFAQSAYEAGASLAHWDRALLERRPG